MVVNLRCITNLMLMGPGLNTMFLFLFCC
uniref:Predicted protein n=1 Tax=Hordeum vulgare subsp. vulgare TaxID=112509 RepID=F2E042_HORVV|nr:predicted protein [Hordeum vulgare subsp. vulgare]